MAERGHKVTVLTSRYGTNKKTLEPNGVIRSLYLQADIHHYRPFDFFLKRPAQERNNARQLRQAINQIAPQLIVIWGMWNLSLNLPYWAEQWLPGCVAYYIASTWPIEPDLHQQYWLLPARNRPTELVWRHVRRLALQQLRQEEYPPKLHFTHAMCCSKFLRETLVQSGALPTSAGVLYNGIDPKPFYYVQSNSTNVHRGLLRLLYFGRLIPQKGIHTAIEALGLLKQRGLVDLVALTVLGDGHPDYKAYLQARVAELALGNHVSFVSQVSRDEIPSWLQQYDVFLFTSTGPEAMARTVMEAMAAGILVIGTAAGGQAEMLTHEENSLTFQAEDAAGLAHCIERVIKESGLSVRLAKKGRQMILKRFTLDRMVDEVESWFGSIIP